MAMTRVKVIKNPLMSEVELLFKPRLKLYPCDTPKTAAAHS